MSECLIGDSSRWSEWLPIVNKSRFQNIDSAVDYERKLSRIVVLKDEERARRIALIVDLILGVVKDLEEGETLIDQHFPKRKNRLSEFSITYPFIT